MKIELNKFVYFDPITRIRFKIIEKLEDGYNIELTTKVKGYVSKEALNKYLYLDTDTMTRLNVAANMVDGIK